jgi:hypothetical protein
MVVFAFLTELVFNHPPLIQTVRLVTRWLIREILFFVPKLKTFFLNK